MVWIGVSVSQKLFVLLFLSTSLHGSAFAPKSPRSPFQFATSPEKNYRGISKHRQPLPTRFALSHHTPFVQDDDQPQQPKNKRRSGQRIRKAIRRTLVTILASTTFATAAPRLVHAASAPVMALPKAEGRDPGSEALMERQRQQTAAAQQALRDEAAKAREIESLQGIAARRKFEQELEARKQAEAQERTEGLKRLKLSLLQQGIDPFTDMEGKRQIILYEKGVDLGEVPGTPFHLEQEIQRRTPKKSWAYSKQTQRAVIACIVQDMQNRGEIDPVEYFEGHQDKTLSLLNLQPLQAKNLLDEYRVNLEEYGQITVPKPGETPVKELMAARASKAASSPEAKKAARAEAKRIKAEQKAAAKAEKERQKAEAKAAKEAAKLAKQEAAAASTLIEEEDVVESVETASEEGNTDGSVEEASAEDEDTVTITLSKVNVAAAAIASGITITAGGFVFKTLADKAAKDEDERQRQLKLLMGEGFSKPEAMKTDIKDDTADDGMWEEETAADPVDSTMDSTAPAESPKKRLGGLKKMFGAKKSDRVTDLNEVVGESAQSPEFALLLAKLLTFGVPGRFPDVVSRPGGMPMDTFDLAAAQAMLSEQRVSSGLELQESAEIFADVVNCMLIDIVDLASASLKEKSDDATVKSINIVVDFMNHAASLYDSVAEGVVIKPVTYGGTLRKNKLEQMYSTYAVSGMMNAFGGGENGAPDDFDSRVALLQDVFEISEKKAEGLMMKAVQKNMMQMMKDGKGMEGMQGMLGGMGGLEGMEGMLGGGENGEEPSPEELKELLTQLKTLKDAGAIPPEEFAKVRKQFKDVYGSSIDDVVKEAGADGELSGADKELVDLMKAIMDD